jgi:hypothetical protein
LRTRSLVGLRRLLSCCLVLPGPLSVAVIPARGDVTLRYELKVTVNPNLPQATAEQLIKSSGLDLPRMQIQKYRKGELYSAFYYSDGDQATLQNPARREITLLDTEDKRYTTLPLDQYVRDMVLRSPQASASTAPALKDHWNSIATGRTRTIHGVEAEEHNVVQTVDFGAVPGAPVLRLVVHMWVAAEGEIKRVPALGEVANSNAGIFAAISPDLLQRAARMPGLGDGFFSLIGEFRQLDLPLRMDVDVFAPAIVALTREMPQGAANPLGTNLDTDSPLLQLTEELTDLSTAEISDSVFRVPPGFTAVSLAELRSGN